MMWYLTSTNEKRVIYVLPPNNVTIGRTVDKPEIDFPVPDDASLSRKHALLSIEDAQLYLQDLGSKYGTFLNNSTEKIEHNVKVKLNSNDIVKFGKMGNIWKVNNINFITCTSTMKGDDIQSLRKTLKLLDGVFKNDWDESCVFLTMPAITLTIKVVLALVQNSNIVTTDYWTKCVEAIQKKFELPNPNNFVPVISESTLNKENVSFLPMEERNSLFKEKKIIFFSRRQFEMYKLALFKSSGTPLLLSETKMTKQMLCNTEVIVIQYNSTSIGQETQTQREQINEIIELLKSKGKRVIADAEIGLAILFCSVAKYCNPDFSFSTEIVKQIPATYVKQNNILAQESQEPSQTFKKENVEIDESLTPRNCSVSANSISLKRKSCDDFESTISETKRKATVSSNTLKRIIEDDDNIVPNKKVALNNDVEELAFNFLESNPPTSQTNKLDKNKKKLNLFKPSKRKIDERDAEECELFNFVEDQNADKFINNTIENTKKIKISNHTENVKNTGEVNVEALRGNKLNELMEINANIKSFKDIKKEDISEIDDKLKNINFGSTTLVVKNNLIIKREPLSIIVSDNGVKNFKKFKKVWPVKLQITLVSNVSDNTNTTSKLCPEEDIFSA